MNATERKLDALIEFIIAETPEEISAARAGLRRLFGVILKSNDPERIIRQHLLAFGCPDHLNGYNYAVQAILYDLSHTNYKTMDMYSHVANHFRTTPSRVERGIRSMIESSFLRIPIENIEKYFGGTIDVNKSAPTNSLFVSRFGNIVRDDLKAVNGDG